MFTRDIAGIRSRQWWAFLVAAFPIAAVSMLKAFSIWHHDHFFMDEQAVVYFSVGFLDYDFNPRWFGYHTLPMYILYPFYHLIYCLYLAAGLASSKSEFVSLLFSNDAIFFVTARLIFGVAYTTGIYVLARIIWKHFKSPLAAAVFFVVASIFPDSMVAGNYVRVDSFVFLFLALTVYFSCFAAKGLGSFLLSAVCAAAAFCSKFPAIVVLFLLFVKTLADVRAKEYPRQYLLYLFAVVPAAIFIFMPYALLDFPSYKPLLSDILTRSAGQHLHVGKVHFGSFAEKGTYIYEFLAREVGLVSLLGSAFFAALSLRRRDLLFSFLFVAAYGMTFVTSKNIDSYWYRPVFPFLIFFTFAALLLSSSKKAETYRALDALKRRIPGRATGIAVLALALAYADLYALPLKTKVLEAKDVRKDTRLLSREWINQHLPERSRIWVDGVHSHYYPKVLPTEKAADLHLHDGFLPQERALIKAGFELYYAREKEASKAYDVRILGQDGYYDKFSDRLKLVKPGDYVMISSWVYDRYYDRGAMNGLEKLAAEAREYYAIVREQECVAAFKGKGPEITVYKIKEDLGNPSKPFAPYPATLQLPPRLQGGRGGKG